jgi:RHS repeat-associated protein
MDTLATATLLTDFIRKPYQFFLNLPFGETMAEQHSHTADFESRYKFNNLSQFDKVGSKELQDELGLAWYDYGARNYDAAVARFMNIDRYADNYSPLSPYQYTANNPVLYIDYNGDYIVIGINDDDGNQYSVMYDKGKAYHYTKNKDGTLTKGSEYDGDQSFIEQSLKDLGDIGSTKQGERIINKLQESSDVYTIKDADNMYSPGFDSNDNSIYYTSNGYGIHDGVSFDKSHINLGHELAHAYDKDRGFDMSFKIGDLPASELNAVRFENYLRALDGQKKMRLSYTFRGTSYNMGYHLGGKSAEYFKHSSLPLGRNEVYRSLIPTTIDRSGDFYQRDNTYVKPFQPRWTIYDTKRQKIVTF